MINIKNWLLMKWYLKFKAKPDISLIPKGIYCYSILEEPSIFNNFRLIVKPCPYYAGISRHSVGCKVKGYVESWGTMLNDQCKICGINE